MNPSLCLALVLSVCSLSLRAEEASSPEKTKVTKLDGTSLFGIVEVTDDYTVRIRSDSGIQNIPLAVLSEKDFRALGFSKDRSKDGRFWSERENALESEKASDDADSKNKESQAGKPAAIEVHLAELAPFQPLIAAYESLHPPKNTTDKKNDETGNAKEAESPSASGKSSSLHMFTGPGSFNIPASPFSGPATTVIQPAVSAASSAAGLGTEIIPTP